jgi:hypothetical protein
MSLKNLKNEIESALMITEWSPTESELKEILKQLKEFRGKPTKSNIASIVLNVVGSYEALSLEGEDNSDLTTLLLLATKTVPSDD